jgi:hypothetical protein
MARVRSSGWLRCIAFAIVTALLIICYLYIQTLPPVAVSEALGGRDVAEVIGSPDRVELAETGGRWWLATNGGGGYHSSVFKPAGPYVPVAQSDAREISEILLNRTNYNQIGGNALFPEVLICFKKGKGNVELQVEGKFDHVVIVKDGRMVGGCSLRPAGVALSKIVKPYMKAPTNSFWGW